VSELYAEDEDACHLQGEDMLQQAIHRLLFLLVRTQSEENPFESPVAQFCAFRTINKEGMWILASEFAPFLSGIIHCMQIWLSEYCIQAVPASSGNRAMESLIRQECEKFLVNTTHSPIAKLSYWRLLSWKVINDVILHPVTTINEEQTAVMHLHVTLPFDALQSGLHAILEEAKHVLEDDLMFELHAAPRFKAENVVDNPSNLGLNFCFLDNPRNNFAAADW